MSVGKTEVKVAVACLEFYVIANIVRSLAGPSSSALVGKEPKYGGKTGALAQRGVQFSVARRL